MNTCGTSSTDSAKHLGPSGYNGSSNMRQAAFQTSNAFAAKDHKGDPACKILQAESMLWAVHLAAVFFTTCT